MKLLVFLSGIILFGNCRLCISQGYQRSYSSIQHPTSSNGWRSGSSNHYHQINDYNFHIDSRYYPSTTYNHYVTDSNRSNSYTQSGIRNDNSVRSPSHYSSRTTYPYETNSYNYTPSNRGYHYTSTPSEHTSHNYDSDVNISNEYRVSRPYEHSGRVSRTEPNHTYINQSTTSSRRYTPSTEYNYITPPAESIYTSYSENSRPSRRYQSHSSQPIYSSTNNHHHGSHSDSISSTPYISNSETSYYLQPVHSSYPGHSSTSHTQSQTSSRRYISPNSNEEIFPDDPPPPEMMKPDAHFLSMYLLNQPKKHSNKKGKKHEDYEKPILMQTDNEEEEVGIIKASDNRNVGILN